MPVPIREDGRPGPEKRLIVFVHGFCSDPQTWKSLTRLLKSDNDFQLQFDVACFEYKTGLMALPVKNRLPEIAEIASLLDPWLKNLLYDPVSKETRYINATLIGHSMGGLIIQTMLTKMLEQGRGAEFQFIRQAIFFATPHLGSITMEGLRGFLGMMIKNSQDEMLRGLNQQVAELHQKMQALILQASRRDTHCYPLPCACFWGLEDNIVPEVSARGFFPVARPLPGDHNSIHCPQNVNDQAVVELLDCLQRPHGHSAIFEIEKFRYTATVKPLPPGTQRTVKHGRKSRVVESDNEATVVREVTFGANNRCRNEFELKYKTCNDGFIEPFVTPKIEMRPDHRSNYEENGVMVNYLTPPEPRKKFSLSMTVLRGFESGQRDYHQHFTNLCYFRRVQFELDLTAYLDAGWRVSDPPKLYYHSDDSDHDALCQLRKRSSPDPTTGELSPGKWRWELEHIHHGVLDIKWDVEQ